MRALVVAGLLAAGVAMWQGGETPQGTPLRKPKPPTDAELLPPVQDPPPTAVDRGDLIQRFVPDTPLTGFWRLRSLAIGGSVLTDGVRGFLSVGRSHFSIQIVQQVGDKVVVQSGFRTYRIEKDELVTTALIGFDNHNDGEMQFEPVGFVERRRFEVAGAILRVMQGDGRYMEFERVE